MIQKKWITKIGVYIDVNLGEQELSISVGYQELLHV